MTPREDALCLVIDDLIDRVEELACTCVNTDEHNRLHVAPGRRRKDSRCSGVSLAVTMELRKRRALRRRVTHA